MDLIEDFLQQYNKQYEFYTELGRIGNKKLEAELAKRGIKAIVTYRAKRPDRIKDKLVKRIEKKSYSSIADIYEDIADLAGVRIALYFPSDRELVDEIVKELFTVTRRRVFPELSPKPKYTKRFSGYWATHYRVEIRKADKELRRFQSTPFEIQVASVLMHGWAEVEHDLVYKTLSGSLSDEELAILDEINGLVLSGEIALERLQKAISKRTIESKVIGNRYELTNLIVNSLGKNYINKLKLGNTKLLNIYFKTIKVHDIDSILQHLSNINLGVEETVSEQLLNMFIRDYFKESVEDRSLKPYLARLAGTNKQVSGIDYFVKLWAVLDKALHMVNEEHSVFHRKYYPPEFDILADLKKFNENEIAEFNQFKMLRNQLIQGIDPSSGESINSSIIRLKQLTHRVIDLISDEDLRETIRYELKELR